MIHPSKRPAPAAGTRIERCARCRDYFYRSELEIRPDEPDRSRKFVCQECAAAIRDLYYHPAKGQMTFDDLN